MHGVMYLYGGGRERNNPPLNTLIVLLEDLNNLKE